MPDIRARSGETVVSLSGSNLLVEIREERFGPFTIDSRMRQRIWSVLEGLSIPLTLGSGATGVGGSSHEIHVSIGGTSVAARWWMTPPPGWEPLHAVFSALAAAAPKELTSRYDFGAGGE